jgi:hypothetical protein
MKLELQTSKQKRPKEMTKMKKVIIFLVVVSSIIMAQTPNQINKVEKFYLRGTSATWATIDTTDWDTTGAFKAGALGYLSLSFQYRDTIPTIYFKVQAKPDGALTYGEIDSVTIVSDSLIVSKGGTVETQEIVLRSPTVDKLGGKVNAQFRIAPHWVGGSHTTLKGYAFDTLSYKLWINFAK